MKTINENNGLTIEQLEERFEMTVAECKNGEVEFSVNGVSCGCVNLSPNQL